MAAVMRTALCLAIIALISATVINASQPRQVEVLRLEDLPDLEAEAAAEFGIDVAVDINTITRETPVPKFDLSAAPASMPAMTAAAVNKDEDTPVGREEVEEFARWMTDANDGLTDTFAGSGVIVTDEAPSDLVVSTTSLVVLTNAAAVVTLTSVSGTRPITFSISPALPSCLSFASAPLSAGTSGQSYNAVYNLVTGSCSSAQAATTYTITATNHVGSTSTHVTITIIAPAATGLPPFAFSYSSPLAVYTKDVKILANSPTLAGTPPFTFSVSPALPTGLAMSTAGYIKGTPTALNASRTYTVTVTNTYGSATAALVLSVVGVAPSFSYKYSSLSYVKNAALVGGNTATVSAATTKPVTFALVTTFGSGLPSGLTVDSSTGAITGTPGTDNGSSGNAVISCTNSVGVTTVTIAWSVTLAAVAPTLSYTNNVLSYPNLNGTSVTTATFAGSAPITFSVSPSLPSGLSLDTVSGAISGSPTVISSATVYTVTATNSAGKATASVTIRVTVVAAQSFLYSSRFPAYKVGQTVSNTASLLPSGQTYTFVALGLPAGLSVSSTTGELSGTPTAITPQTNYPIAASNSQGTLVVTLSFAVNAADTVAANVTTYPSLLVTTQVAGVTAAEFNADAALQLQFRTAFAAAFGVSVDLVFIYGTPFDGASTSSHGFVTQDTVLNVNMAVQTSQDNDPDVMSNYAQAQSDSGDFAVAGFSVVGISSQLVPHLTPVVSSSSAGTVASSSTGTVAAVTANDPAASQFAWGSVLGVIVALIIVAVGVAALWMLVVVVRRYNDKQNQPPKKAAAEAVSTPPVTAAATEEKTAASFVSTEKPVMGVVVPAKPFVAAPVEEEEVTGFTRVPSPKPEQQQEEKAAAAAPVVVTPPAEPVAAVVPAAVQPAAVAVAAPTKERIHFHPGMEATDTGDATPRTAGSTTTGTGSGSNTPTAGTPSASPAPQARSIQSPWLSSPRSLDAAGGYMLDGTVLSPAPQQRGLPYPSHQYDSDAPSPFVTGRDISGTAGAPGHGQSFSVSLSLPGPLGGTAGTPQHSGPPTPAHTAGDAGAVAPDAQMSLRVPVV